LFFDPNVESENAAQAAKKTGWPVTKSIALSVETLDSSFGWSFYHLHGFAMLLIVGIKVHACYKLGVLFQVIPPSRTITSFLRVSVPTLAAT
jgi:hypothetical protein